MRFIWRKKHGHQFPILNEPRLYLENLVGHFENKDVLMERRIKDVDLSIVQGYVREVHNETSELVNYRGLINLGNTCYMNSYMQALFMTMMFRELILEIPVDPGIEAIERDKLAEEPRLKLQAPFFSLVFLFRDLISAADQNVNPSYFRLTLPEQFSSNFHQHDTSEFGKIFLDRLEEALKDSQYNVIIKKVFGGIQSSSVECLTCRSKPSERKETFYELSLGFEDECLISRNPKEYDLRKMIWKYFKPIEFDEKLGYQCSKCRRVSQHIRKKTSLIAPPEHFVFTLNRFAFSHSQNSKIFDYLEPLPCFDLSDILDDFKYRKGWDYSLYAIVIHSGVSPNGGHYYTYARSLFEPHEWYQFNDSYVTRITNFNLREALAGKELDTPYVLFYQRTLNGEVQSEEPEKMQK
eukprot:TRINITY_DN4841_c0_g1_i1.p1 TRINITY_DN4841_c0_g1~~TRINITY_DN4841_c0_g1_i1.p1  ORF type:complete len:409 (-),score=37.11 TRINITY_DN4841_c0_g1_i1:208-1434(-)